MIIALMTVWPPQRTALMLFTIMEELSIFPIPAWDRYMESLMHDTCAQNDLLGPRSLDEEIRRSFHSQEFFLVTSLSRVMHALHTSCFFVHTGYSATLLAQFLGANYRDPVLFITDDMKEIKEFHGDVVLARSVARISSVPRIFLAGTDVCVDGKDVKLRYDSPSGDVVKYDELNNLLISLKTQMGTGQLLHGR